MQRGELWSGIDDVPEVDNGDGAAVQAHDVSEVDKGDSVAVQAQGSQPPEPSGRRRCRHGREWAMSSRVLNLSRLRAPGLVAADVDAELLDAAPSGWRARRGAGHAPSRIHGEPGGSRSSPSR